MDAEDLDVVGGVGDHREVLAEQILEAGGKLGAAGTAGENRDAIHDWRQLLLERVEAVGPVDADPRQLIGVLVGGGEPVLHRGRAEIAGGLDRRNRGGVELAGRVAEEVHRNPELLLQHRPRIRYLMPEFGRAER